MRVRLDCAYDGTDFSGWARQPGRRTVQGTLEATIAQVLRLDAPPGTMAAGRTDAGVHARGQVVHVDLMEEVPDRGATLLVDEALARRLPRALPKDIALHAASKAPEGFDARFSALNRRYVYRLWDSPLSVDPLHQGHVLAYGHRVDVESMAEAAVGLLGLHDFVAFCRPKATGTTIRTLLDLTVVRTRGQLIEITVVADAFCHSMVRSLVGGLLLVGRGHRGAQWIASLLHATGRSGEIGVAPAHGLTLEEVTYPPDEDLAARASAARARRDEDCGCPS